jgi:hypothetical protein
MGTAQTAVTTSAHVSAQGEQFYAAGLAMIAGYVDAYGYLTFKTYVSFMSGNSHANRLPDRAGSACSRDA